MGICLCATTGVSTTTVGELQQGPWNLKGFLDDLQHWDFDVPGLLLDDGFLHCLLDDFRLLHFDGVDDVLNMRVHTLR